MAWTRDALETRVAKLAEEHEGEELVAAVKAFAEQLSQEERDLLGWVLMKQAPKWRGITEEYAWQRWSVILPRIRKRRR